MLQNAYDLFTGTTGEMPSDTDWAAHAYKNGAFNMAWLGKTQQITFENDGWDTLWFPFDSRVLYFDVTFAVLFWAHLTMSADA